MYELVKSADARGGSHVHAWWLQDNSGDEGQYITQSTSRLMVARLLASASRHVDEKQAHDWVVGFRLSCVLEWSLEKLPEHGVVC